MGAALHSLKKVFIHMNHFHTIFHRESHSKSLILFFSSIFTRKYWRANLQACTMGFTRCVWINPLRFQLVFHPWSEMVIFHPLKWHRLLTIQMDQFQSCHHLHTSWKNRHQERQSQRVNQVCTWSDLMTWPKKRLPWLMSTIDQLEWTEMVSRWTMLVLH